MPTFSAQLAQTAAAVVGLAFTVAAGFMVHWALGRTWGLSAHWGGVYKELPGRLRAIDTVSAGIFVFGIFIIVGRAWSMGSLGPERMFSWGAWSFAALLGLSGAMNLASSSKQERFMLGPAALLLAVLCFVIARSEWTGG